MAKLSVDRDTGLIMLAVRTAQPSLLPDATTASGCKLCSDRGALSVSVCRFLHCAVTSLMMQHVVTPSATSRGEEPRHDKLLQQTTAWAVHARGGV